jgi:glycosyltransferase involved in cell wall biosynthesis
MPEQTSLITTLWNLAEYLDSGAETSLEGRMSRVCNSLRPHSGPQLVSRIYLRAAMLSGSPKQARFVTDVLTESEQLSMARVLAEEAARSATKSWHRTKLNALKEHEPRVSDFDHRRVLSVAVGPHGITSVGMAVQVGGETVENPEAVDPKRWFSELVSLMERGGPGYFPDVLRVHLTGDADLRSLSLLLSGAQMLPLVPLLIADNARQAHEVQRLCRERGEALLLDVPVGLATAISGPSENDQKSYTFIGFMDRCLLSKLGTARSAGRTLRELDAQMLGGAAVWLARQPAFRGRRTLLFDGLRQEACEILPLLSRGRSISSALAYHVAGRERSREAEEIAASLLEIGFYEEALGLLDDVPESHWGAYHLPRLVRALYGVADFDRLCDPAFDAMNSKRDSQMVREGRAAQRMLSELSEVQETAPKTPFEPVPGKVVSILHASQPSQSGGYANRAHQLLRSLGEQGLEVAAYTRPGFPEGENRLEPGEIDEADFDGVAYRRIGTSSLRKAGEYTYMEESVSYYRQILLQERPSVVHLRSTYVSALPGCIAAKSLGLPVVYEVSGMWELVYEAKNESRMEGRRARTVALENAVLCAADAVSTLTGAMRDIIRERVSLAAPVDVLPNAVDPHRFAPQAKSDDVLEKLGWLSELPVVGYAGTFVDYEGLDVLMRALAILKSRGAAFQGLMVGDGAVHAQITHLAEELDLGERVRFTGRVPHEEVDEFYSVVDICVYPRKRTPATVAVSPLKPFEALASEKTVIVSDVPALTEIAGDNERALIVRQDDPEDLADAIQAAMDDPLRMAAMRKRARTWVEQERSWSTVGSAFAGLLTAHTLKAGPA